MKIFPSTTGYHTGFNTIFPLLFLKRPLIIPFTIQHANPQPELIPAHQRIFSGEKYGKTISHSSRDLMGYTLGAKRRREGKISQEEERGTRDKRASSELAHAEISGSTEKCIFEAQTRVDLKRTSLPTHRVAGPLALDLL